MCSPGDEDRLAIENLVPLVYDELRAVARTYFRKQPPSFTLRPTELVDEACLHLLRHAREGWKSPEHFRAIATHKIWQVIVDHVRTRRAQKRGGAAREKGGRSPGLPGSGAAPANGHHRVPLDLVTVEWRDQTVDVLDLADALEALAAESHRLWNIVMLHWFAGLKYADVARLLNLSASSVEKDFRYAKAWLNRRLAGGAVRGD